MISSKMNGLKILFSTVLLLILFSCSEKSAPDKSQQEKEEITFIGLSNTGGQLGYYRLIKVTKDSLHFETGQTVNSTHKEYHAAIQPEIWKNLSSSFKIKNLDSIESSPSIQPIDGVDESFQIKTTKKSHVFVNAQNDDHYDQFAHFKEELFKIIPLQYQ